LRNVAPDMPVVLLINRADEPLARKLLREGAQDYLIRDEIDCEPLARTVRNAMERQRFQTASRCGTSFDQLTGLYNERGFQLAATRELHLAAGAAIPLLIALIEIDNLGDIASACGTERRDITILDAAEVIRAGAGDLALLACLSGNRFAAVVWNMNPEGFISRVQAKLGDKPRDFGFAFGWAVTKAGALQSIDPLLSAAEALLCENKQSYQTVPETLRSTRHTA
jgi:PleD family two-component response regulator